MNSIKKKNIILSFKESNNLPYDTNDVSYYDNISLNEPIINNTLQQLVDNDLYIENELLHKKKYQVGPKQLNDNISSDYTDGVKYWNTINDGDGIEILHKINKPISSTVYKINTVGNDNIKNIIDFGQFLFAEFDGCIKYMSVDSNISENVTVSTLPIDKMSTKRKRVH